MFDLVVFSIKTISNACTVVFNVSKDHELRSLIVIAQFQIWHETHSLFRGLKLVGLTKSFQMSMYNQCYYLSICNGIVWITVFSQCFGIIHECNRDLQAKTIDREFKAVKNRLQMLVWNWMKF